MISFGGTEREAELRDEVQRVLAEPAVREALAAVRDGGPEPDVRPLYRELGRHRLLAASWPPEFGGRGASHAEAAAVIEELVLAGMPDMLHVLSIQIVGLFLLRAGSADQRATYLPRLADGSRFATVLYTEPAVGSDLAALQTRAERDGSGYLLTGVKIWGLKSQFSDLGLCAARTSAGASKYDGISLFLVDLNLPGVDRGTVASVADDQFDQVEFSRVRVPEEARLGAEGEGWALLSECLSLERTGVDYSLKAQRWYDLCVAGLRSATCGDDELASVGRMGAQVAAARLLAWDAVARLDRQELDTTSAAIAKLHTSTTAQEVALWAAQVHGCGYGVHDLSPADATVLEAAYREAPGLTLSAGTSQIMLELIANSAPDRLLTEPGR